MPKRPDVGKDKYGLKGMITERYSHPRIFQASDTFHCQPPMLLIRAFASLAGRKRVGQEMFPWAHTLRSLQRVLALSLFRRQQLPYIHSVGSWSKVWATLLLPSDAWSLHWFLSVNTGKQMWIFQDRGWVNSMSLRTSHRDSPLKWHLMSKILFPTPIPVIYILF